MLSARKIHAGSVTLSPYVSAHDLQTVAWLSDRDLRQLFGLVRSVSIESHRRWIETTPNLILWAILVEPSGRHVGNAQLLVNSLHENANLQIYFGDASARGRGLGRQTMAAVLRYAFDDLKLHRIWLHTSEQNEAAIRLYKWAGFTAEGVERESIRRDGTFENQIRWALLSREWRKVSG